MAEAFIYGHGNKSIGTVKEILDVLEVPQEYYDLVGHGLSIGGLFPASLDSVIRFSHGTDKLVILAPELEPLEFDAQCNCEEDGIEEEAQE